MSQVTYFKPYHVYALHEPLAPNSQVTHAIIITGEEYLYRRYYPIVSVLLLYPRPRDAESNIRVRIDSSGSGGKAQIVGDQYALVDSIFPMEKANLRLVSESKITRAEELEIKKKVKDWLALGA